MNGMKQAGSKGVGIYDPNEAHVKLPDRHVQICPDL